MSLSMYGASVPVYTRQLNSLLNILDKAEAYAAERKFDTAVLLASRLAPDMLPLTKQVQIATDHVKGSMSRLAGKPVPSWADDEVTLDDLRARIRKALALLAEVTPAEIDGSEERPITLKLGGHEVVQPGQTYLLGLAMPNFYFHVTTAYAILRHNGVPVGKRDFIGG